MNTTLSALPPDNPRKLALRERIDATLEEIERWRRFNAAYHDDDRKFMRFLPHGNKVVVVGVITSKFGELENKDDVKRRLEEAAKFAALEQLAVSPQCGFASTEEGNLLSEEEQWAKLKLAVDVANEVWGK